jgi:prephenate dehydratase
MIVGFQGEPGAFSEGAARALLGDTIETRGYATFDSLLDSLASGEVAYALLPRENNVAGIVTQAQEALERHLGLIETRAITYPIEQCLIGLAGASLQSIVRVCSHPVALAQCTTFFAKHPHMRQIEADDTAASVRRVVEKADASCAAIASSHAADLYGAIVLARGIADRADNHTRFSLLVKLDSADVD